MAMIPGVLPQDARTYFEELVDVHKNQKSVSRTAPQGRELADSKRLLKYRSFPGFGRGFDSHRPLQKLSKQTTQAALDSNSAPDRCCRQGGHGQESERRYHMTF